MSKKRLNGIALSNLFLQQCNASESRIESKFYETQAMQAGHAYRIVNKKVEKQTLLTCDARKKVELEVKIMREKRQCKPDTADALRIVS